MMPSAVCLHCNHVWSREVEHPLRCPACMSRHWDDPRPLLHCTRCNHDWLQHRKEPPERCPRCHSRNYTVPDSRYRGRRLSKFKKEKS